MSKISEPSDDQAAPLERLLNALKLARTQLEATEFRKTEPIAIIGMGCRFPFDVKNPQDFWQVLHNGVDGIGEIPKQRWDIDSYYHPDPDVPGKMYTRYGGFLSEVDTFDPQFFGISPREAECMDPQQRLLLEVSWEAIENAGLASDKLQGSETGLFMGISFDDYSKLSVNSGDATRIDAYSSLGNSRSIAVGRLAYILGVHGPVMQLDTSCSSSLLGVHLACQSLRSGESNLALAGGVNLMLSPEITISFCKLKALAADGRCKTFDASADGYARGEGCGIIVLKRLSDAKADGDNILALIRGSAVNHDGRSNGLTAPNGSAQEVVIRQALENARVKPEQIQYVEAHGTGTSLGDPIEVLALSKVFGQGRSENEALYIGSVKTNFGHLEAASGVASIIKVVLSLQNKKIPPSLHFKQPNPYIPWEKIPITVPTEPIPWSEKLKFAGVSSFGMSGTNVHAILEAVPEITAIKPEKPERPLHLLTLSAKSEKALGELAKSYEAFLLNNSVTLGDVCFTANTGRSHFDHRLAVISESTVALREQLKNFLTGTDTDGLLSGRITSRKGPKIAFLFVGEGEQYIGMGRQLYETQPTFRAELVRCDEILRPYLDKSLLDVLYPASGEDSPLDDRFYTQIALFALKYAIFHLWKSWGIEPDILMAHGVGEYVAACVAGVFSLEEALKLITTRGRLMQQSLPNEKMVAEFAVAASEITYHSPQIPLISYVNGQQVEVSHEIATSKYWVNLELEQVKFPESIALLKEMGYEMFLEISLGCESLGWQQILQSLGQLYVQGLEVNWSRFDQDYAYSKVVLPTYPFQRERYWMETNRRTQVKSENLHPFLGKRLRLPFCQQIRFESQLGIYCPPHQEHHRLFGINIVAAASHVSLILSAVQEEFGTPTCTIEELFFQKALVLPEKETRTVQIIFNPENQTKSSFEIISLETESEKQDTSWVKHVTGSVSISKDICTEAIAESEKKNIQGRCLQPVNSAQFYNLLNKAGYTLGSAFSWIGEIWQGEGEALGRMFIPELPDRVSDYQLYPGLLDSCFQVLGICSGLNELETLAENNFIFIPFHIQSFQFFQQPKSNHLWCYARRTNKDNTKEGSLIGDILIFDEVGEVIAKITNFEVRKASRTVLSQKPDLSDWFYQLEWQLSSPTTLSHSKREPGRWLIFAPANGLAEQLAQTLELQGQQCILVRPGQSYQKLDQQNYQLCPTQPEHFQRLVQEISLVEPLNGIAHLWSLDTTTEALANAQELSCGSVLNLLKAIVSTQSANQPPMWLITQGVHQIGNDTNPLQLQQAPLWGLGRAIAKEHPELCSRCLDLEWGTDTEQMVKVIVEELLSTDAENQIAYRQVTRQVARLSRAKLDVNTQLATQVAIKSEGCYLITGGLGALGLLVAQWMAQQGAKHLVLTGRREPSPTAQQTIKKLETAGTKVLVLLKDISQEQDVADILKQIEASGTCLRGAVHTAGVLDDGLLINMNWERFTKVMKPKVEGAWHLHKLTKHLPLDFFVCFSSIASLLGSTGQGNYAAANAFLDALAHHRRAIGLPGLSINWGPWAESGMTARLGSQHLSHLQNQGITLINPEQGLRVFTELFSTEKAQLGVFPINWSQFLRQIPKGAKIPNLEAFISTEQLPPEQSRFVQPQFLQQLESAPIEMRRELLINYIRSEIAKILSFKIPEKIGLRERFFELGIDSLMAVELKNILEFNLGCSVRSTILFDYPTLEALVDYLIQNVLSLDFSISLLPEKDSETELSNPFQEMTQDELAKLLSEKLEVLDNANSKIFF